MDEDENEDQVSDDPLKIHGDGCCGTDLTYLILSPEEREERRTQLATFDKSPIKWEKPKPPKIPIDKANYHKRFTKEEEQEIWAVMAANGGDTGKKTIEELARRGIIVSNRALQRRLKPLLDKILENDAYAGAVFTMKKIVTAEREVAKTEDGEIVELDGPDYKTRERASEFVIEQVKGKAKQRVAHEGKVQLDLTSVLFPGQTQEEANPELAEDGEWTNPFE